MSLAAPMADQWSVAVKYILFWTLTWSMSVRRRKRVSAEQMLWRVQREPVFIGAACMHVHDWLDYVRPNICLTYVVDMVQYMDESKNMPLAERAEWHNGLPKSKNLSINQSDHNSPVSARIVSTFRTQHRPLFWTPMALFYYSLRPIIFFANIDVFRHIFIIDISVFAKINMGQKE
jgi:hypothetical protein